MKRKIKDLTRQEMYMIAKNYAYTSDSKSGEYFSEKYNISQSTFYNILHKVVAESIVSVEIARCIKEKAASNAERHAGVHARERINGVYNALIRSRDDYHLTKEEAKKWVRKYIESELDIDSFAIQNYLKAFLLKRALNDAIVYLWIKDEEIEKLKEKIKKQKSKDIDEAFEKLFEKRKENKK